MKRSHSKSTGQLLAVFGVAGAVCLTASGARAQVAGTAAKPIPDVMLLVDTSGSMERMPDNTIPICTPGTATEPNRWGMLLQALTGNIQPYFSCAAVSRASTAPFRTRYQINGQAPYDVDYALDYHQPLAPGSTNCAWMPWKLPGVSANGVGSGGLGTTLTTAVEFPFADDALAQVGFVATSTGHASDGPSCVFEQTLDGQLDVARNYARFGLMTFDNDTHSGTGLSGTAPNTSAPFKGQWSYLRSSGNPLFSSASNAGKPAGTSFAFPADETPESARGMPGTVPACTTISLQEIGARNEGAPPWEGRMVPFPPATASIYDLARHNQQLQEVLLATRPYGATPIDGMMDDARDYFWYKDGGPKDDPFPCRDRYIILLTDGAPNMDLRPSCAAPGGICPYPKTAGQIAAEMFAATGNQHVKTYVIGFSVNGVPSAPNNDGFPTTPAGITSCRTWFEYEAGGSNVDLTRAQRMQTACNDPTKKPPPNTTGAACCMLNEIGLQGSGVGAFFAESQADIVLSFGRIMANIIQTASTKTLPVMATKSFETVAIGATTTANRGLFISSFIPSSQRPWSGDLDRTRYQCIPNPASPAVPAIVQGPVTQDVAKGDYMSENLARQSAARRRVFISVKADADSATGAIDSAASVRPFANPAAPTSTGPADGIVAPATGTPTYSGEEVMMTDMTMIPAGWNEALGITRNTCKRGRAVKTDLVSTNRGTINVPALDDPTNGANECTKVVWGFTTATPDSLLLPAATTPKYEFNTRCRTISADGTCSISGDNCTPSANPTTCPVAGETCIPKCAALGAIYHSTPAAVTAPESLLREEGFRSYQGNRRTRRTMLYTATTDGILHAFKALDEGDTNAEHEVWAFVPPAALPKLASNYPGGNQIILDGAPVVRETLWDRKTSDETTAQDWHTTLVAGLGTTGGYYALNVTDADCGGAGATGQCFANYEAPTRNDKNHVSTSGRIPESATNSKKGPHFLWQLTDVPAATTETGKVHRKSKLGATPPDMVALFGKNTSTPAIGTVAVKTPSDGNHLVGVAILPGGYEDPPINGLSCPRAPKTAAQVTADRTPRSYVRQWDKAGCSAPVPGRGVTIVRLDSGEIVRHFGRLTDIPARIAGKTIDTPFDSPMVGTPVIYPDKPGVPIQKIFIGDADGTVWRIDLTNADPSQWKATLYSDLFAVTTSPAANSTAAADISQPIMVPPVISLDEGGNIILNVATGDQESIIYKSASETNYVYSIMETRDQTNSFAVLGKTLWYRALPASERVTGPMTVFDRVLYFASFVPAPNSGVGACTSLGYARLWGLNYTIPETAGTLASGGRAEWCPTGSVDGNGLCTGTKIHHTPGIGTAAEAGTAVIPGVTLTRSISCVTAGSTDAYGNGGYSDVTSTTFSLNFGSGTRNSGTSATATAERNFRARPIPLLPSRIDSWSLVVE